MAKGKQGRSRKKQKSDAGSDDVGEDVWVQCDECQKWRRLPPRTVIDDNAKWYCAMNPDTERQSCDVPEENYNEQQSKRSKTPRKPKPKDLNDQPRRQPSSRKPEAVSVKSEPDEEEQAAPHLEASSELPMEQPQQPEQPPEPVAEAATVPVDTQPLLIEALVKAKRPLSGPVKKKAKVTVKALKDYQMLKNGCHTLLANAGTWTPSAPNQPLLTTKQFALPDWLWSGLAHYAPEAADAAAHAIDVFTSSMYFVTQPPVGATVTAQTQLFARLCLITAASSVLQRLDSIPVPMDELEAMQAKELAKEQEKAHAKELAKQAKALEALEMAHNKVPGEAQGQDPLTTTTTPSSVEPAKAPRPRKPKPPPPPTALPTMPLHTPIPGPTPGLPLQSQGNSLTTPLFPHLHPLPAAPGMTTATSAIDPTKDHTSSIISAAAPPVSLMFRHPGAPATMHSVPSTFIPSIPSIPAPPGVSLPPPLIPVPGQVHPLHPTPSPGSTFVPLSVINQGPGSGAPVPSMIPSNLSHSSLPLPASFQGPAPASSHLHVLPPQQMHGASLGMFAATVPASGGLGATGQGHQMVPSQLSESRGVGQTGAAGHEGSSLQGQGNLGS